MRSPAPSRRVLRPQRRQDGGISSSASVSSSSSSEAAAIDDVPSSSVAMDVETADIEVAAAGSPLGSSSSGSGSGSGDNIAGSDATISMAVDKTDAPITGITSAAEEEDSASATTAAASPSKDTIQEGSALSSSTGGESQGEKSPSGEVQGENNIADRITTDVQTSVVMDTDAVTEVRAPDNLESKKEDEVKVEEEEVKGGDLEQSTVPKEEEAPSVKAEAEGVEEREGERAEEGVVDLLPVKSESAVKVEPPPASSSSAPPPPGKAVPALDSKPKESAAAVPPLAPEMLSRAPDSLSAIHSLRGFMDVGNASLFHPSEPWVLATAALLAKRKLSKG